MRIIIRRPHAYFFLNNQFEKSGGLQPATAGGGTLAYGSEMPLPGIYVLDEQGGLLESVAIINASRVVEALRAPGESD